MGLQHYLKVSTNLALHQPRMWALPVCSSAAEQSIPQAAHPATPGNVMVLLPVVQSP